MFLDSERMAAGETAETHENVIGTVDDVAGQIDAAMREDGEGPVTVGGRKIMTPSETIRELEQAMALMKQYFPEQNGKVLVKSLPGKAVGEAVEDGIYVDPWTLAHPEILAAVLLHEAAHQGGEVENEGLVESYSHVLLEMNGKQQLETTDSYGVAVRNFGEFIDRLGEDAKKMVEVVYGLYKEEKFEDLYMLYEERYMDNLGTKEENDAAFQFFKTVFPELDFQDRGEFEFDEENPGITKKKPESPGSIQYKTGNAVALVNED